MMNVKPLGMLIAQIATNTNITIPKHRCLWLSFVIVKNIGAINPIKALSPGKLSAGFCGSFSCKILSYSAFRVRLRLTVTFCLKNVRITIIWTHCTNDSPNLSMRGTSHFQLLNMKRLSRLQQKVGLVLPAKRSHMLHKCPRVESKGSN